MKMWRLAAIAALVVFVQSAGADAIIPENEENLVVTTGGRQILANENVNSLPANSCPLFDGARNRWLGIAPNPGENKYPSSTITFTTARPLVNAYRVFRGSSDASKGQARAATKWELYGSNDDGETWTLLHAQTESVTWYSGTTRLIDTFDCAFDNAVAYSSYKFRVTANGGASDYVSLDDVALYCLKLDDMLSVEHNGYEVGEPTPAYGAVCGLKEGDKVTLSMADTVRAINPTTSRRYELTGFTISDADGRVLHEGTPAELPYEYVHGARWAKVVWKWSDPLADFVASHRTDLTVAEGDDNEISDGRLDGGTMTYINGNTRANYGPQYLFDADETTTESRWDPNGATPYYAQYVFKPNGVETRRSVTGIGLNAYRSGKSSRYLYGFDFQGSNDGTDWTTLLSVTEYEPIISRTWDFPNSETYSRYRFVVTKADSPLEMYNLAFYSYRDDDVLEILGSPAYGTPDPDYGIHVGLAQGQEMTLTAPSAEIDVSEDEKSVCTGYALAVDGAETVYGAGTSCAYVHAGKGTALTWLFASSYRQRVAVLGAGAVDCEASSFVVAGTALTITATPAAGCVFLEWRGDVPKGQSQNPTLAFTVDRPRSLTAVFSSPVHVSATGDDANDGTSWAQAVRTVARGWELCGGVGRMLVGEGEFSVKPDILAVTGNLKIEGRGRDRTVLVADNSESTGTLLSVGHELAMVTGVCVKGARQKTGPGAGLVLTAGVVTNCCFDSCTTSTRGGGVWLNGTGTLVDSVVTNCTATVTGGGVYFTAGTFRRNLVTGCSAPDGGGAYFAEAATVADSAFCGNKASSKGGALACDAKAVFFTNCVFEANVAVDDSGVINSCPGSVVFEDCLFAGNKSTTRRSGVGMHFGGVIRRSRLVGNGSNDSTYGGVLYLEGASLLANCLVANTVGGKGAIYGTSGTIVNCTVVSNRCNAGGAMWSTGGNVRNTIFACNVTGGSMVSNWTGSAANATYSCIEAHDPAVLGEGSISDNPRFTDAANGDYTLRRNSPCVNRGANAYVTGGAVDLAGKPRIHSFGGRAKYEVVDMGCYESPWRQIPGLALTVR